MGAPETLPDVQGMHVVHEGGTFHTQQDQERYQHEHRDDLPKPGKREAA